MLTPWVINEIAVAVIGVIHRKIIAYHCTVSSIRNFWQHHLAGCSSQGRLAPEHNYLYLHIVLLQILPAYAVSVFRNCKMASNLPEIPPPTSTNKRSANWRHTHWQSYASPFLNRFDPDTAVPRPHSPSRAGRKGPPPPDKRMGVKIAKWPDPAPRTPMLSAL